MGTLNVKDANTRTVTFNGNTVEKIILNGTLTWVKRPTPSAATFTCSVRDAADYASVGWSHSGLGSSWTNYHMSLTSSLRDRPRYWIVGRNVAVSVQGGGSANLFPKPTLASGGNGYYVGDTYNMRLPTTISRLGITWTTKSQTGTGTAQPMKFKVKSVTTPYGDVSSTNGVFGSIKTWEVVRTITTNRNPHVKWGQYKFRRSNGQFLYNSNHSTFTLTGTADVPSYKD